MRGKRTFNSTEAALILIEIGDKQGADRTTQKACRDRMRAQGFYISDFGTFPGGFTKADFHRLVDEDRIKLRD